MSHHLYRIFDEAGTLLYVGISRSALRRLSDHLHKHWPVSSVRIETHPTKAVAAAAELQAIRTESPLLNIRGRADGVQRKPKNVNRKPAPPTRAWLDKGKRWKLNWYWLKPGETYVGLGPEDDAGEIVDGMETPFYMYYPRPLTAREVWWEGSMDRWPKYTVDQVEAVLQSVSRFVEVR